MRCMPHLKRVLIGPVCAGAILTGAPVAGASELPKPVIDTAGFVEHVRGELSSLGVELPALDTTTTDAVDDALQQAVSQVPDVEIPDVPDVKAGEDFAAQVYDQVVAQTNPDPIGLQEATQPDFKPVLVDPNYVWRNDMFSKVAAGKPFEDFILHRAPGSYFDAPRTPEESNKSMSNGKSLYGPGTPIYINDDTMCTLTMAGTDAAGRKVGVTAGHCANVGDNVASADSWQVGPSGTVVSKNEKLDYAVIEFGSDAEITNSYNGVTANGVGGQANPGDIVCKRGVATGTTCGVTFLKDKSIQLTQLCATVGDSGAPVLKDGKIIGSVSGGYRPGNIGISCVSPLQGAVHVPTISSDSDVVVSDMNRRGGVGAGFKLA